MADTILDTFTGTVGTTLATHIGETGATWRVLNPAQATLDNMVLDGAGRVRKVAGNTDILIAPSGLQPEGDFFIELVFNTVNLINGSAFSEIFWNASELIPYDGLQIAFDQFGITVVPDHAPFDPNYPFAFYTIPPDDLDHLLRIEITSDENVVYLDGIEAFRFPLVKIPRDRLVYLTLTGNQEGDLVMFADRFQVGELGPGGPVLINKFWTDLLGTTEVDS